MTRVVDRDAATASVRDTMPVQDGSEASRGPAEDPWRAFAWIVSGVLLYGGAGWLGDHLLGTRFLVPVGIVLGAGLGIYLVFVRFASTEQEQDTDD